MCLFDLLTPEQQEERYSCCIKKKRHASMEEARISMRRIKDRGERKPLHVYHCPYCLFWHVGGCSDEQENKIRIFDGFPFKKVSIQHGPEDASRYRAYLQRKGYWVRITKRQNAKKTRRNYYIYAYHPVMNQAAQAVRA
ncbi:MAG TPA: hypothetical protein VN372_05260 [Methanospirillum sp.]|nr:hypothetical protein [Methanospirillum sp.]